MMTKKELQEIRHKLKVLNYAVEIKNISKTCRHFGISRDSFYRWKANYAKKGEEGLINCKPCPENPKLRFSKEIEEKIILLRTKYHFGPEKISWYMKRYLEITVSASEHTVSFAVII